MTTTWTVDAVNLEPPEALDEDDFPCAHCADVRPLSELRRVQLRHPSEDLSVSILLCASCTREEALDLSLRVELGAHEGSSVPGGVAQS